MRTVRGSIPDGEDAAAAVTRSATAPELDHAVAEPGRCAHQRGQPGLRRRDGPGVLSLEWRGFSHRKCVEGERRIDVVVTGRDAIEHATMHELSKTRPNGPMVYTVKLMKSLNESCILLLP
jgi:hypothetical protein